MPSGGSANAVRYAVRAGEHARDVYAYEEAVKFYGAALGALDLSGTPDPSQRCDLLLALGEAQMPLGHPREVAEGVATRAFAAAEAADDHPRASRACRMVLEALHRDRPGNTETPEWRTWADRADAHAAPGTSDRAYADVALARAAIGNGDRSAGIELLERALKLARTLNDPELLFTCAWQAIYNELTPGHWRRAVALAEEFATRPHGGVRSRTVGQILEMCGAGLFAKGDLGGAASAWHELGQLADQTRDAFNEINAMSYRGLLATVDGRLEEAVEIARHMLARGEALGTPRVAEQFAIGRCGRAFVYLGLAGELESYSNEPTYGPRVALAAYGGRVEETRALLRDKLASYETLDTPLAEPLNILHMMLDAAVVVQDLEAARPLADWLRDGPPASPFGFITTFARHLGAAAALAGARETARSWYERGLQDTEQLGFRPELALTRLQLAELLLQGEPGERAAAHEHLDAAIAELRAMHMQPALERALAIRARQRTAPASHPSDIFPAGLSAREVEVLGLIAAGKSNREIAEALVISPNTVIRHVSNILTKTGAANRAEAAVFASRHGLL